MWGPIKLLQVGPVAIDFKWVINITENDSGNSQDIHQIPINFKFFSHILKAQIKKKKDNEI